MTPDVSSVLAAVEEYATLAVPYLRRKVGDPDPETGDQDWEDYPDPTAQAQFATGQQKVQQAAEQACYRDRLATLERIWPNEAIYPGINVILQRWRDEIEAVRQLLAGSA